MPVKAVDEAAGRVPVTVVVPVLNEERNLPACLESVQWAREIFVVDSGSRDRTEAIAGEWGARVVQFHYSGRYPKKKNWALANLPFQTEWVFLLDADERVTPELAQEIRRAVAEPAKAGYYVNRRLIFLGRWIRWGGWYPSWNMRLFRVGRGRYERMDFDDPSGLDVEVHEHVVVDGPTAYLGADLLHHDLKDLSDFVSRLNKYSTWDAHFHLDAAVGQAGEIQAGFFKGPVARKRWLKRIWVRLPLKPVLRFVYMYIVRGGFLDGRVGLHFALLMAVYEYLIAVKRLELRLAGTRPSGLGGA